MRLGPSSVAEMVFKFSKKTAFLERKRLWQEIE